MTSVMAGTQVDDADGEGVSAFLAEVEPRLRQLLVASLGIDRGGAATASALEYAWLNAPKVMAMMNPVGYLAKVGRSQTRERRKPLPPLFDPPHVEGVEFEPALPSALADLSERQRVAVFLVVGCGWPVSEVARTYGVGESTVHRHVERGMNKLRTILGVDDV